MPELVVSGSWTRLEPRPGLDEVLSSLPRPMPPRLRLREHGLTAWDSTLLALLWRLRAVCREEGILLDASGLGRGLRELLQLAAAAPERAGSADSGAASGWLDLLGDGTLRAAGNTLAAVRFTGEVAGASARALLGKARFMWSDVLHVLRLCGPDVLPIITLVAFLMGLILAFVGAIQLRLFGAEIYVADLVGIGIVRAMGAIMTGVVMAGRSGAAFAAQLGTMQVNEEVDAFRTMGIDPVEFLVLPRLMALTAMMPLLCLYANVMGILGGMLVGVGTLDIGLLQYWTQTLNAVGMNDLAVGLCKGVVFGILISLAGCLRGMQCGRSSLAVGNAATSAVVTAIVWIVVATAVITVLCDIIGI